MSAYANIAGATKKFVLSGTPQKVGTGASGVPLANRLLWRGRCDDVDNLVEIAYAAADLVDGNGFTLLSGIPELRADGPAIDIWAWAITGSPSLLVSEEA